MYEDETDSDFTEQEPTQAELESVGRIGHFLIGTAIKLEDVIDGFRDAYFRNLEEAVEKDIRQVCQLPGITSADLHRILPTIYDGARCNHAANWEDIFVETWGQHPWDQRGAPIESESQRAYKPTALSLIGLAIISPFVVFSWVLLILRAAPVPSFATLTIQEIIGIIGVLIILTWLRSVFHRFLPYTYLTFALVIECSLAIAAVQSVRAWSPAVNDAWRSLHAAMPVKYRVLLPTVHPTTVVLITVWLIAVGCIVRLHVRFVHYVGVQNSDGRPRPGYRAAARQSAVLILGFFQVSYDLSEWERGIPDKNTAEPRIIAAKIPPEEVRKETDRTLAAMAYSVRRYWKVAMRSARTPGRSAGEQMAHNASRIEYFLQYQRLKNMLGGANFTRLREAMTTALVQSADGDWHLIGKGEDYEAGIKVAQWKTVVRRSVAIVVPIAVVIATSEFAHKIPAIYIQTVLFICFGFAAVQILGLIDPDAPARLDVASRVSSIFKH